MKGRAQGDGSAPHEKGKASSDLEAAVARELAAFPEIAVGYLFGSRARGEPGPESDLDVGLVLKRRGETAEQHYWWICDLASRLESTCPGARVDVVLLESQGPIFAHRVLLSGRKVFEADRARRIDFESETVVRALDFLPTYEIVERGHIRRLARRIGRAE